MKKLKKIYYVPGLFSAILIPLIFWYYGSQRISPKLYVLDLGIPAKAKKNGYDNTFEPYRNWKYQKITVKPNTVLQNQKFYISELKKLQKRNIKETGIEFAIGSENTLQDLISLIDVMKLAKQDRFGIDVEKTGHFFAVHFYKNPNESERGHETVEYGMIYQRSAENNGLTGFNRFQYFISQLPKQAFYIIFGYLILLNISILSLIRKSF